jgi:hypothetical protein
MKNLRLALVLVGTLMIATSPAGAQRSSRAKRAPRCDTIATTSIAFGRTAGNIMPTGLRITPSGAVRAMSDSGNVGPAARTIPTAELRRLATRAWRGPFARLPTAPTRPTPNPDMARDFVELRSACGRKHVEMPANQEPAAFRKLFTQLQAAAGTP